MPSKYFSTLEYNAEGSVVLSIAAICLQALIISVFRLITIWSGIELFCKASSTNCNAIKDGKCLRYRLTWRSYNYNADSFIETLQNKISVIEEDTLTSKITVESNIINGDVRKVLDNANDLMKFKLCITSPPYLNTFDYTDIYRPELFL
ncbi:MAG TPA: hypothetical protein VKT28_19335 [Puia sp.]|nr:hypothetical protein [Puia sp.]